MFYIPTVPVHSSCDCRWARSVCDMILNPWYDYKISAVPRTKERSVPIQVSVEPRPSALNMTLPACAAEHWRLQHGARSAAV